MIAEFGQPHQLGGNMAYKMYSLQCHGETDADVVAYLEKKKHSKKDSMNAAMKRAIRKQIAEEA